MPILAVGTPGLFEIISTLFLAGSVLAWGWALGRITRGRPLLPPPCPARAPWRAGSILVVVVTYLLVTQAVTVGHTRLTGRHGTPESGSSAPNAPLGESRWTPRDLLVINAVIQVAMIAAIPLLLRATSGANLTDLGFGVVGLPRNVLRGLVACALVAPGCNVMMAILSRYWPGEEHPLVELLRGGIDGSVLALAVVTAVVLAPLFEELLFRGLLLGWMSAALESDRAEEAPEPAVTAEDAPFRLAFRGPSRPGPVLRSLPAVVTSLLFALMHQSQGPAPAPLFLLALVLAALTQRTGSLWASITLHASFNALNTLLLILSLSGREIIPDNSALPAPAIHSAQIFATKGQEMRNREGSCLAVVGPWVTLPGVPFDREKEARSQACEARTESLP